MSLINNISALNAHRMYNKNYAQGSKATEKLASGKRITKAADDAAGLGISEKMKSQIRGLDQAAINTKNAIELTKVADSGLGEITNILQRMRELSVQASNGILTTEDISAINSEFSQLSKEIDSISKGTEYNQKRLIDGSLRALEPMRPEMIASNSTKNILDIHGDNPSQIKSSVIYSDIEIHDGKPATTDLVLKNPISLSNTDNPLIIQYTDKYGSSNIYNLNLTLPFSASGLYAGQLAGNVQDAINNCPGLKDKIIVRGIEDSINGNSLFFESFDKENNITIGFPNSPALQKMKLDSFGNPNITQGRVRNDQISITYSHKDNTDKESFNRENGYLISGEHWISEKIDIDIPIGEYNVDEFISKLKSVIPSNIIDNELLISNNLGRLSFSTADEGREASLMIASRNNSYILNDLSIAPSYHQLSILGVGQQDKTDTFAIEINAQYKEIELKDEDLSKGDLDLLDKNGIIYTTTGYIIEDPYNPQDYLRYDKIEGTGEIIQLELSEGFYNKGDFGQLLEKSINDKVENSNNKVKVSFDYNGNLKITTSGNLGSKSSVKFIPPDLSKATNYSPHNTTSEELLHHFLDVTGFDYNRHIGKNGTDQLYVQTGANSGDNVLVKIGSVRTGGLGIKRLEFTDSASASNIISKIDKAIAKVSSERTNIGAFENRFEHIVNIAENSSENLTASESKISDADMAKEIMESSKIQVLMQASQAMIARANEEPKRILDILK